MQRRTLVKMGAALFMGTAAALEVFGQNENSWVHKLIENARSAKLEDVRTILDKQKFTETALSEALLHAIAQDGWPSDWSPPPSLSERTQGTHADSSPSSRNRSPCRLSPAQWLQRSSSGIEQRLFRHYEGIGRQRGKCKRYVHLCLRRSEPCLQRYRQCNIGVGKTRCNWFAGATRRKTRAKAPSASTEA